MSRYHTKLLLPLLFLTSSLYAQKAKKGDKLIIGNLQAHIGYLANDKLEGRRAGSAGEKLAMEYISGQFKATGLSPKGSDGYYQPFAINEGKKIGDSSYFSINGVNLLPDMEYFPFPYSAQKSISAQPAIAIQEADMPWFVDLKDVMEENQQNPHFDPNDYIRTNSKKAYDRGATAVIIYNSSAIEDKLEFNGKEKGEALPLPVLYVTKAGAQKYLKDPTATMNVKINVSIAEKQRTGHNVVGYIDNGAPNTIILGAHFDHLGYGEDGNSMDSKVRTGEKAIHNGADDNASGTAGLIELAKLLKASRSKANNYLFIAFSGEELGLYGSKYYTDHPTIDLTTANYMINMDMIGRLNDSTKALAIGGYGTSPSWATVINPQAKKLPFNIKIDSSGTGPSDHTSFYRKDIPVLFFFTGQHPDYHRPGDDSNKINYDGELSVIYYINQLITDLGKQNKKLAFLKTRESQMGRTAFKVTLGIMPDYTYSGSGVRADGVTDGRPASKAGMKTGDVIIQLGDNTVNSVETYMQALGKFNKGEKTKVKFKRGEETIEAEVQF